MKRHDESYKLLFSEPEMVKDLLTGFVAEEWVHELDLNTLELYKTDFITEKLEKRQEDVVWRVRWKKEWLYIYLTLAFQSNPDRFMAIRTMVYMGLLYQTLITQKRPKHKEKLPPILPIVIYNGKKRWTASLNTQSLIADIPPLRAYCPQISYFLLDEHRFSSEALRPLKNLVASLFRFEKSQGIEEIQAVLSDVIKRLKQPEHNSLRRAISIWLKYVLIPEHLPDNEIPELEDLEEIESMLAETVKGWYREAELKGHSAGRERGLQEGIQKGISQGELQAKQEMLIVLVEKRFEKLTAEQKQLITQLKPEQIMQLCIELLTMQNFNEMLEKIYALVNKNQVKSRL